MFIYFPQHRDTPHHLKNKRVQQGLINDKATNALITQAIHKQHEQMKLLENSIPEMVESTDTTMTKEDDAVVVDMLPIPNVHVGNDITEQGEFISYVYIYSRVFQYKIV